MLTKLEFDLFRKDTERAMREIANKYGVEIHAGKIKYTSDSFFMEIKANRPEVNGKSFEQSEFEKYAFLYGFDKTDYNKQFRMKGQVFTVYGFKASARTMPVLARGEDGKNYKFGTEVKRLIIG